MILLSKNVVDAKYQIALFSVVLFLNAGYVNVGVQLNECSLCLLLLRIHNARGLFVYHASVDQQFSVV